jgi:OOP family OmpA-OmpF porin
MPSPIASMCRKLTLAAACLLAVPCALAQQPGTGAVLPPPSLYDDLPPKPAPTGPVPVEPSGPARPDTQSMPTGVQPGTQVQTQPVGVPIQKTLPPPTPVAAPQPAAAPVAPAPPPQPAAAPVQAPQPAAAPIQHAPPAATAAAPVEPQAEEEPWYRRLWPFGRKKAEPAPAAAAPVQHAATPPPTAPTGRAGQPGDRPPLAYDSPSKAIRTTVIGDCVKTGFYDTDRWGHGACPGATPEPVAAAAPTPAPAPRVVEPEPVQVQPLRPEPVEEPHTLTPEPAPVAAPPPPPPPPAPVKTTTLSADTLFALNSFQLRPQAKAKLDEFASELDQFDYRRIHITGHTDPTGSRDLNERLSRQRAEAVKRYLVNKGLPASKIVAEGMGSAMPVVPGNKCAKLPRGQMVACYQPDRRVELEVSGVTVAHK